MRFQTKIAVFVLAVFLTLAGVNLIANGIERGPFVSARQAGAQVTVEVSDVHILT